MKKLLTIGIVLASTLMVSANSLGSLNRAKKVQQSMLSSFMDNKDVNGVAISGCNPKTGQIDTSGDFVYCVVVYVKTYNAKYNLQRIYPPGTMIKKVFIAVEYIGEIEIQPGMTVGN